MTVESFQLTDHRTGYIILLFEICQSASIVLAALISLLLPDCTSLMAAFVVHQTSILTWDHEMNSFLAPTEPLVHLRWKLCVLSL